MLYYRQHKNVFIMLCLSVSTKTTMLYIKIHSKTFLQRLECRKLMLFPVICWLYQPTRNQVFHVSHKDGGGNKNWEGRKDVSFTGSISCACCQQHSGLCITENTQHGTQTCPSWGYHTASLMWSCKSWAVSIPQDLWLPTSALRLFPPQRNVLQVPLFSFPSIHSMNMHLTVTNSFFWCLSDVFLLNLKWHFPA